MLIQSWLSDRTTFVCVDGILSKAFGLDNMVYQGTVLGPPLWNVYYADACKSLHDCRFTEAIFADDLNAFRSFVLL